MAAELGFQYSLTHLQNLAETTQDKNQTQSRLNPMQNQNQNHNVEDDDSWEVRAFAEDTANVMGTTWPPRSYTCTYCRREFRSAQALGGHMNVHRRDRALRHQAQPHSIKPAASSSPSTSFIIPPPDFVSNGGLCLLYQFPNPNDGGINSPTTLNAYIQSPSSLLAMSHHSLNNLLLSSSPSVGLPANDQPAGATAFSQSCYRKPDEQSSTSIENGNQELDLELRLGQGPSARTITEKEEKICNMEAACLRKRSD